MSMLSLRPYQNDAATFLFERDRAMVLAPVGAGKTAITLTAMRDMVENHSIRWLVIAPLRVAAHVWPVEAKLWAPSLNVRVAVGSPNARYAALYDTDADVVVTNYDNLQWLADHALNDYTGVVFDELTRLKNPSGKRFKALQKIIESIDVRPDRFVHQQRPGGRLRSVQDHRPVAARPREGRVHAAVLPSVQPRHARRVGADAGGAGARHEDHQAGHLPAGAGRVQGHAAATAHG
jgi:replicative superfamily II helicase